MCPPKGIRMPCEKLHSFLRNERPEETYDYSIDEGPSFVYTLLQFLVTMWYFALTSIYSLFCQNAVTVWSLLVLPIALTFLIWLSCAFAFVVIVWHFFVVFLRLLVFSLYCSGILAKVTCSRNYAPLRFEKRYSTNDVFDQNAILADLQSA
ncbi:hypothetical protein M514_04769 [Trichuris suis]|uniref:Uncharacterized protein n=1 Tax=Trichuris suis TaxID=68888 RepID=A0A085MUA5_9BILA|nr:hypothetical protein M513_04769 [Trichuris suis]KFD60801.1 hypothetical protein M514_04769 [Trichuris suis]